jgi:predicted outer membrane repeat protein
MILAISAVSAADTNDTSDSVSQAVDEAPVEEVASEDVDPVAATDDAADVLSAGEKNFTQLRDSINSPTYGMVKLESNYTRVSDEDTIVIDDDLYIDGQGYTIDANNAGGIFKIMGGHGVILNNIVFTNANTENGGAIYNDGTVIIQNCKFINNHASLGGAVYNTVNGDVEVSYGSTFDGNTATNGGAIYSLGAVKISDSTFNDNTAEEGGAVYIIGSDIIVNGAEFTKNIVNGAGGAMSIINSANVSISGSTFTENEAKEDCGGAIIFANFYQDTVAIDDCTFTENKAIQGGAIALQSCDLPDSNSTDAYLVIDNSRFVSNVALNTFGINYAMGPAIAVASEYGNQYALTLKITNSNITGHTGYKNGAITTDSADLIVDSCYFADNTAYAGAAIYSQHGSATITDSRFVENTVTQYNNAWGLAGAVYAENNAELTVTDSYFINNTAYDAGALRANGKATVTGTTFTGNKATSTGGAIASKGDLTIIDSTFTDNTADKGNAIYNQGILSLSNNIMDAGVNIENSGTITSTVIAVVTADKATYRIEEITLTATLTDDKGNAINDTAFKFVFNTPVGLAAIPGTFNGNNYTAKFIPTKTGEYSVTVDYVGDITDATFTVYRTLTDLAEKIAAGNPVVLDGDYTYNAYYDGDIAAAGGIAIGSDVTINGNGYTICGNDTTRLFKVTSGTLTLNNVTLCHGNATNGACVYVINGATLNVDYVNFTDNHAKMGVICSRNNANVDINHAKFANNDVITRKDSVPVISAEEGGSLIINNSVFENNVKIKANRTNGDTMYAIIGTYLVDLEVYNSNFTNNSGVYGGALTISAGSGIIDNCRFINNTAYNGGAININWGANVDINNSYFEDNVATEYGSSPDYTSAGGAIAVTQNGNGVTNIIGSTFKHNSVIVGERPHGGAVSIQNSITNIESCVFEDNEAPIGNAVFINDGNKPVSVIKSEFINNGGADDYSIVNSGNLLLSGNTIDNMVYSRGIIASQINVTTYNTIVHYGEKINLTATITDDNGNLIDATNFYFVVNNTNYGPAVYNPATGKYEFEQEFNLTVGTYEITMKYDKELTYVEKGNLTAFPKKGTFTDLQYQINVTEEGKTLDLSYNFTYTRGYDDVQDMFDLTNGVVVDKNITINGNDYTIDGNNSSRALFIKNDATLTINNVTFVNGNANNGGAIYTDWNTTSKKGGHLTADYVTFINNTAAANGGAVYANSYSKVNMGNCIFENNAANGTSSNLQGGAVYVGYMANMTIVSSNFTKNYAKYRGGAIYAQSKGTLTIKGSKFIGNDANVYAASPNGQGGAIFTYGCEIYVQDNCEFINNTAGDLGGAIFIDSSSAFVSVMHSTFENNTNNNVANSIWLKQGKLYLEGNTINTNYAEIVNKLSSTSTVSMGIITSTINATVLENKTIDITDVDVTLTAVVCDDMGNLIYDSNVKFNITGETSPIATTPGFENYTASYTLPNTGAVYEVGMTSTKAGETVTSKIAILRNVKYSYTDLQAQIDAAQGTLVLPYDFAYNEVIDGDKFPEGVVISNPISIEGNGHTISGENSHRIFFINATTGVALNNITFVNGSVVGESELSYGHGGAIYYSFFKGEFNVTNSTFIGNNASARGGAIYVGYGSLATIEGSEFYNNTAVNNGGAICVWRSLANIDDCYFEKNNSTNSMGGAINLAVGGSVTNSVFIDNDAFGMNPSLAIGGTNAYVGNCNFTGPYCIVVTGSAILENNIELTARVVDANSVYSVGTMTLINNKFNSTIVSTENAKILSDVIITVLDNGTWKTTDNTYVLNATVTDADGNLIYDKGILFTLNGEVISTINYNDDTGLYTATVDVSKIGIYNVSMTKFNESNIKTGKIINIKGTFTDLQNKVAGNDLTLEYNFTYIEEIDGDALKDGVVIDHNIDIDGKGHAIDGADLARIFNVASDVALTLNNVTLTNGAAARGGAINMNSMSSLVANYTTFANNNATADMYAQGGAILVGAKSSLDLNNCIFENNQANISTYSSYGGAIYVQSGCNVSIVSSNFTNNAAIRAGSAIYFASNNNVTISDSKFRGNSGNNVFTDGGAIYISSSCIMSIEGSEFINNMAKNGAAIYMAIGVKDVEIKDTDFIGNNATNEGGAIYIVTDYNSIISIMDSIFENNTNNNVPNSIVLAMGNLDLSGNTIKSEDVEIFVKNGKVIGSKAILINGEDVPAALFGTVYPFGILTDDMGNLIYDPNFKITIDDEELETEFNLETGVYNATYTILTAGNKTVSTNYAATYITEGKYVVPRENITVFTVTVDDILDNENATVFIELLGKDGEKLNATVTVILNNTKLTVEVINGTGNGTVSNMTHGSYPVVAEFLGNVNYNEAINSTLFYVKAATKLSIVSDNQTYEYGDPITVTVYLTNSTGDGDGIFGIVYLYYYMEEIPVLIVNGEGTYTFDRDMYVDSYVLLAGFEGDNDYNASVSDILEFEVIAKKINTSDVTFNYTGNAPDALNITINSPVDGNYTVAIDGYGNVTVEVIEGKGVATIDDLPVGDYLANITINDGNYTLEKRGFILYRMIPTFDVTISGVYPNATATINGTAGLYLVIVEGVGVIPINVTEDGAFVSGTLENITAGNYTAGVMYLSGNSSYRPFVYIEKQFTVEKANATLTLAVEDIVEGESAVIEIKAVNGDGEIINTTVKLIVSNDAYDDIVNVIDGNATVTLADLEQGHYDVTVVIADDNYNFASDAWRFYVRHATNLTVTADAEYVYGTPVVIDVTLNATTLGGVFTVSLTVGEEEYNVLIENGIGQLTLNDLPVGEYTITSHFDGDDVNNYTDGNVVLFKVNVNEINASEVDVFFTGDYDDGLIVTIFSPVDGNYTVDINGTNATVEVIDGIGTANVTTLGPNDYTATVTIDDGNYSLDPITKNFTYKKAPEFKVNITGTYPTAEIVIMGVPGVYHIDIPGFDTINITVGSTGLAGTYTIENINASEYIYTLKYDANDEYREDGELGYFTVLQANSSVNISQPIADVVYGNPVVIEYNVENRTNVMVVILDKNGNVKDCEFNNTTVTAVLPAGTYTVYIVNEESDNYLESEAFASFTVVKAENLTIDYDGAYVAMGAGTVNITVAKDALGYVVIDNDGQTIYGDLVNGSFAFDIYDLPAGDYVINVTYFGDDNYNKTTDIKILSISKANVTITTDIVDEYIGEDFNFTVQLEPFFATGNITVFIDGNVVYPAIVLDDDYVNATVSITFLAEGPHTIGIQYNGNELCEVSEIANFTTNVTKYDSEVTIEQPIADVPYGSPVVIKFSIVNETDFVTISITDLNDPEKLIEYIYNETEIIVEGLPVGNYMIDIHNGADALYRESEANATFNVTRAPSEVTVLPIENVTYGQDVIVIFTVVNKTNVSDIKVVNADTLENVTVGYDLYDDEGYVVLHDLVPGNYSITISTKGNESYLPSAGSGNFTVTKATPVVNINVETAYYTSDVNVTFTIDPSLIVYDVINVVNETFNPISFTVSGNTIVLTNLTTGYYTIGISTVENENYTVGFNVTSFYVSIMDINPPANSSDTVFTITMPENATGLLLVDIDGQHYYAKLENGTASITVPKLAPGNYTANVTYTGDEKYPGFTSTENVTVESNLPENALTIPNSTKSDEPTIYSINITNGTGYLEVDVDGTKYVEALVNGTASVAVPPLSEGNHNITVTYTGDDRYTPATVNTTLNVTAPVFKLTNNKDVSAIYSAKANYKVLVLREGKAVGAGESVTFNFNGKKYTVKTDAKGYATLKLDTKVKVGKYTVTAEYKGVKVTNKVKIKHLIKAKKAKVKKSKKVNKIKVKTKKVNGKYLKGKKLKLTIKKASKSKSGKKAKSTSKKAGKSKKKVIKAKINKKGKATFKLTKKFMKKLKPGKKYTYTVSYGKDQVTKKLKVKK